MGIINSGVSAIGRLAAVGLLAGAFLFGLAAVVYLSLQGTVVPVPEITGKSFSESEKELASLGLKIKKRANRDSTEAINTVIEQIPKPGETVKTGQMIYVVTSNGPGENGEKLNTLKKIEEEDDSEKIEEMIDDKPKKAKSNSNTRKKADTTRDSGANSNSNSSSEPSNSNKESGSNNNSSEKPTKSTQATEKKEKPNLGGKSTGETKPKPAPR